MGNSTDEDTTPTTNYYVILKLKYCAMLKQKTPN